MEDEDGEVTMMERILVCRRRSSDDGRGGGNSLSERQDPSASLFTHDAFSISISFDVRLTMTRGNTYGTCFVQVVNERCTVRQTR